jgi:hypothetical protein
VFSGGQEEVESVDEEEEDMDEELATPSFEFRFECAKLLIELDETTDSAVYVSSASLSGSLLYACIAYH